MFAGSSMEKYAGTQRLATHDQITKLSLSVDDHENDVTETGTKICQFCHEEMDSNESMVIHTLNVHGTLSTKEEETEIIEAKEVTGKISI